MFPCRPALRRCVHSPSSLFSALLRGREQHASCRRRQLWATQQPAGFVAPVIEVLEDRCLLAVAGPLYDYTAGPGEFNDVVISPGVPFSSIQDAADVTQIAIAPFVASDFLGGIGISVSFSVGGDVDAIPGDPGFDVGVGIGWPLIPFNLPEGVLGPPLIASSTTSNQLIGDAVANATGGVSSAVAGVAVPTDGDVAYQITANSGTLPGYQFFQAVVDPTFSVNESETNDTAATADTINARQIVNGTVTGSDFDVFKFSTGLFIGARTYSVVLDNNPDKDSDLTGTKISILTDAAGGTNPTLAASNVSFGDANAVGPVLVGDPLGLAVNSFEIYVLVENSGTSPDDDYRFVLIENDFDLITSDAVAETEANDTPGTADSLTAMKFGGGSIPSQLDRDFFESTETTDGVGSTDGIETGDLIFAYVDTVVFSAERRSNELDSFLKTFDSTGAAITAAGAEDDNDGPAMPAATFEEIQNEIDSLVDLDALTALFAGVITVDLGDGDDILDAHKVMGTPIDVKGGPGNDLIQGGGGATMTIDGGTGNGDVLEIPMTDGDDVVEVIMVNAGADLQITANGTVSLFPSPTRIETLLISGFDGDDLITVSFAGGAFPFSSGISVAGGGNIDELRIIDGSLGHTAIFRQRADQRDGEIEFVGLGKVDFDSVEEISITPLEELTGGLGTDELGRIVVIDDDVFEFNDDIQNATPIESVGNLLTKLAIDLAKKTDNRPADEDWFEFRAPKTGTFRFDIFFDTIGMLANGNDGLPGDGELTTSLFDANGNLIVHGRTNAADDGVAASISALKDQVYFLRVLGGTEATQNEEAVNNYSLRVVETDTLGPQVFDPDGNGSDQAIQPVTAGVPNSTYNLFELKDDETQVSGPTPRIDGLLIHLRDLLTPELLRRAPGSPVTDVYAALDAIVASNPGQYAIAGDNVGNIAIASVAIVNAPTTIAGTVSAVTDASNFTAAGLVPGLVQPVVGDLVFFENGPVAGQLRTITSYSSATGDLGFGGDPFTAAPVVGNGFTVLRIATATVELTFAEPLEDDRYTLTIADTLIDPAGNALDGENNADEPFAAPTFPSGDGISGGSFVARFTVDSRGEIAVFGQAGFFIDANGNFVFDEPINGGVNFDVVRDLVFDVGIQTDHIFAGQFKAPNAVSVNGYDRIGAYGQIGGVFRFLLDIDDDGVVDLNFASNLQINALPVAGNFDGNAANGDEIGLFDGFKWYFDTTGDNVLDTTVTGDLRGLPIVGDFDGDGIEDLGTHDAAIDLFRLSLSSQGGGFTNALTTTTFTFGFPGVNERPAAGKIDADNADDIALTVPDQNGAVGQKEWYILLTGDPEEPSPAQFIANLIDPFSPTPVGDDYFTLFGDNQSVPIIGNFDPPTGKEETGDTTEESETTDAMAQTAYDLDQSLGLVANSTYNWGGANEKWLGSASGAWYFLTEDGSLYKWTGSKPGAEFVSGSQLVATFDAGYYADPSMLTDAQESAAGGGDEESDGGEEGGTGEVDPLAQAAYDLDQSLRLEANATFNWGGANEKWLGSASGTWYFLTEDGNLYKWTGSSPGAGFVSSSQLVATFDAGYYADPSMLTDAQEPTTGGGGEEGGTGEVDPLAQAAYDLDQSLGLEANATFNWGGANEKWLGSASGAWYFITENGSLYKWTGSKPGAEFVSGSQLVDTFDASYYADPSKLYDAKLTNALDEVFTDPDGLLV